MYLVTRHDGIGIAGNVDGPGGWAIKSLGLFVIFYNFNLNKSIYLYKNFYQIKIKYLY